MRILAKTRKYLPPRFRERCLLKKGTFNGVRFLEVYVDFSLFKELQAKPCPWYRSRYNNMWDWFFQGSGLVHIEETMIDREEHSMDWTFHGTEVIMSPSEMPRHISLPAAFQSYVQKRMKSKLRSWRIDNETQSV